MERNQQVLAIAFKKAKAKIKRIKEMCITSDMAEEAVDKLVMDLAAAKCLEETGNVDDVKKYIDGQQWYVESLVKASGMSDEVLLDAEYHDSFGDVAEESEMVAMLGSLRAAA